MMKLRRHLQACTGTPAKAECSETGKDRTKSGVANANDRDDPYRWLPVRADASNVAAAENHYARRRANLADKRNVIATYRYVTAMPAHARPHTTVHRRRRILRERNSSRRPQADLR